MGTAIDHTSRISPSILEQYDVSGPRYTSYPTADRFVEAYNEDAYKESIQQRKIGRMALPLSIYVHIPFCESLCFFCACNKVVTKHHERSVEYLGYLNREIDLQMAALGEKPKVSQLHFGGGSPTFFSDEELSALMYKLHTSVEITPNAELSIEVDPRTVDQDRLRHLRDLGFNRLSFGVQDFNPEVQEAVHRIQPADQVFALVAAARKYKFDSVNVDLIYGLPKQNVATFEDTLAQVITLKPDRIALYAYAHLPQRFKPQRRIDQYALPAASEKVAMLSTAINTLLSAGYVYIGMDHFALPNDALAIAKRQGRLHRNFQGYSTQPDCNLIGLGVSSIGKVGSSYSQNAKSLETYYDLINQGQLPIERGLSLNHDDLIRRCVIMAIMCQGEVQFEDIELAHMIDFKSYFAKELASLEAQQAAGIITISENEIALTDQGWFFVRGVAMVFDQYLQADQNRARFSKIL